MVCNVIQSHWQIDLDQDRKGCQTTNIPETNNILNLRCSRSHSSTCINQKLDKTANGNILSWPRSVITTKQHGMAGNRPLQYIIYKEAKKYNTFQQLQAILTSSYAGQRIERSGGM